MLNGKEKKEPRGTGVEAKGYLLDTNIVIAYLHGISPVCDLVEKLLLKGRLQISAITVGELFSKYKPEELVKIETFLAKTGCLPVDMIVAKVAGLYRQKFNKKKKLTLPDCLIAAAAKLYGLDLITANIKDFPMKDITILHPKDLIGAWA